MPFGKHKGRHLAQVPTGYLRWLLANVELNDGLKEAVKARLEGRPLPEIIDIDEQVHRIVKPIDP